MNQKDALVEVGLWFVSISKQNCTSIWLLIYGESLKASELERHNENIIYRHFPQSYVCVCVCVLLEKYNVFVYYLSN